MKNLKATVRHESPPEGRKFEEKNEKLSWGWKEFARKDRICEKDRGQLRVVQTRPILSIKSPSDPPLFDIDFKNKIAWV